MDPVTEFRESKLFKAVADISVVHWCWTVIPGLIAGIAARMHGKPIEIVILFFTGVSALLLVILHYGGLAWEKYHSKSPINRLPGNIKRLIVPIAAFVALIVLSVVFKPKQELTAGTNTTAISTELAPVQQQQPVPPPPDSSTDKTKATAKSKRSAKSHRAETKSKQSEAPPPTQPADRKPDESPLVASPPQTNAPSPACPGGVSTNLYEGNEGIQPTDPCGTYFRNQIAPNGNGQDPTIILRGKANFIANVVQGVNIDAGDEVLLYDNFFAGTEQKVSADEWKNRLDRTHEIFQRQWANLPVERRKDKEKLWDEFSIQVEMQTVNQDQMKAKLKELFDLSDSGQTPH